MGNEDTVLSPPASAAGERVHELRTLAERSQSWLARAMKDRGHPWHQPTVHRVEAGERTVSIDEAADLAGIFAVPVGSFARQAP